MSGGKVRTGQWYHLAAMHRGPRAKSLYLSGHFSGGASQRVPEWASESWITY